MNYDPVDIAAAVARGLAAARDRAQPDDAGKEPENYARWAEAFRRSAWRHLAEDDVDSLPQSSNKAWGLVAETIKAVSAHHGGIVHSHRSFLLIMRELSELARGNGDVATAAWLNIAFDTARALLSNFYENEKSANEVADGLQLSEQLSERLYELFRPERPTP